MASDFPSCEDFYAAFLRGERIEIAGKKNPWTWLLARCPNLAGFVFHTRLIWIYFRWTQFPESGYRVFRLVHVMGTDICIEGMPQQAVTVYVANHQSTLETNLLGCLLWKLRSTSCVAKASICNFPIFGKILLSLNPVLVTGKKPREDLVKVMDQAPKRLADGQSIYLFPSATRAVDFDPARFNTMGIKIAKRVGVPIVAVAVRTDFMGLGRWIKDFGKVYTTRPVCLAFSGPMTIEGTGAEQHQACIRFIEQKLAVFMQGVAQEGNDKCLRSQALSEKS